MLIVDEVTAARHNWRKASESTREKVARYVEQMTEFAKFTDDPATSPLNSARKLGRTMTAQQLETKLSKLNPKLRFRYVGVTNTKKAVCIERQDGTLEELMLYPATILPERSMWKGKEEIYPDPQQNHVEKLNQDDMEWVPLPGYESRYPKWGTWRMKDPTKLKPGWLRKLVPTGEAVRGWRTVLVKLIACGALTPEQVERNFGSDDTPEWKQHTGKGPQVRPW